MQTILFLILLATLILSEHAITMMFYDVYDVYGGYRMSVVNKES